VAGRDGTATCRDLAVVWRSDGGLLAFSWRSHGGRLAADVTKTLLVEQRIDERCCHDLNVAKYSTLATILPRDATHCIRAAYV